MPDTNIYKTRKIYYIKVILSIFDNILYQNALSSYSKGFCFCACIKIKSNIQIAH